MSMSVCVSVREDISGTTRAICTKFLVHVAHVCGSVLLSHVDDRSHRLSAGRGWRECRARAKWIALFHACRMPRASVCWRVLRTRRRTVLHARLPVTVRRQVLLLQPVRYRWTCYRARIHISRRLLLLLSLQASDLRPFTVI